MKKFTAFIVAVVFVALMSASSYAAKYTFIDDNSNIIPAASEENLNEEFQAFYDENNCVLYAVIQDEIFASDSELTFEQYLLDTYGITNGLVSVMDPVLEKHTFYVYGDMTDVFTDEVLEDLFVDVISMYYNADDSTQMYHVLCIEASKAVSEAANGLGTEEKTATTEDSGLTYLGDDGKYYLTYGDSTIGYNYPAIPNGIANGSNIEFTQANYVNDEADIFSDSEEADLFEKIKEIREKYKFDLVVHTCNSMGSYTVVEYADQYFDFNGYGYGTGRDGLMFLLNMGGGVGNRDYYSTTNGIGETVFDNDYAFNSEYGKLYEDVLPKLRDGDYYEAYCEYIRTADSFLNAAIIEGEPYSGSGNNSPNYDGYDYDYDDFHTGKPDYVKREIILIIAALVIGFVVMLAVKSKMKTNAIKTTAGNYQKPGSMQLTESNDVFVNKTVTRVARPKETSSSKGSGGGSHSSAGGGSHGGGGGKF